MEFKDIVVRNVDVIIETVQELLTLECAKAKESE